MKQLKSIFIAILFIISIISSIKIYKNKQALQQYKSDIIELSDIKYGLLNVDTWENLLADVIVTKLKDFDSEKTHQNNMKEDIETLLKTLINDYEKIIQKKNSGELFGSLKNSLYSAAFADIKKDIPMLTEKVMAFLDVSNNQDGIKQYIVLQLKKYTKNSFPKIDYSTLNSIIKKHEGTTKTDTNAIIIEKTTLKNRETKQYLILLAIVFLLILIFIISSKNISKTDYLITVLFSFLLLYLGVTLPMIEIDARISDISFTFLNEPISFSNQVLFYKSKSIYEVVVLMISQKKIGIITVGGLIFLFSILFPLTKLIATCLYLLNNKLKNNKILLFFIFKTSKWSMADVFVIAIIMTFIGFEGIISEQLNQLTAVNSQLKILTTNNSTILFGFYAFTAFVLISLSISNKIQHRHK